MKPAVLTLFPLFCDRAVFQRDQPIAIWGNSVPNDTIEIEFRGERNRTIADCSGRWLLYLRKQASSSEGAQLKVSCGNGSLFLKDIVVGDIWVCSGQSNMEFEVCECMEAESEIADSNFPLIRHFKVPKNVASTPADFIQSEGWVQASTASTKAFTAIGYFFAREIYTKLGVPIGIINSTWGGTPIESWLPEATLRKSAAFGEFRSRWELDLKSFHVRMARHPAEHSAWMSSLTIARETRTKNPIPWPHPPIGPGTEYAPGALFNCMVAPLTAVAIRGILWYQGESNVDRPSEYAELFPALIQSWRSAWATKDFPFLFVQLAN